MYIHICVKNIETYAHVYRYIYIYIYIHIHIIYREREGNRYTYKNITIGIPIDVYREKVIIYICIYTMIYLFQFSELLKVKV